MKTKILKSHGYYKLVVDDTSINSKYKCEDSPIVLGCITEFADASQWRVEDYRLRKNLLPSPYIEDGVQQYLPKNEEEKAFLLENLHTFKVDKKDGSFYWPKFDSTLYEGGDLPCLTDKALTQYNSVARFTFDTAFKLLQEQKAFWTNFDKDDLKLDEVRIDNPYRQIGESDVSFHFIMKTLNLTEETKKKNKP